MKKKPGTSSSTKRLEVYDFDASDDVVQSSAQKIVNKYSKIITINEPIKSRNHSPVAKYNFLRFFAHGTGSKPKELSGVRLEVDDDDTIKERLSCFDEIASSGSTNCVPATDTKSELVTINIDDDDIESSASTSSSKLAGNEGALQEQALENHFSGCAIDNDVVVWPDYIIYGERYSRECQITFSSSCIKVECSAVCGDSGSFCIEWTVGDIIKIESQWCDQFQTAAVNLLVKLGDNKLAEDAEMNRGIAELRFAVFDPHWHKQQETIKSMNAQYKTKWIVVSDIDARSKDGCLEKNNIFISKHYFPNHDESLKEVVYPRGDPDAVSISSRETELLQPERFINDTIIDFYIKYLENKIKPEEKHRFHFFNCFFFRKLADLDKDRRGAGDSSAAFQRVRKWTRKVNLFEKDYIFIPVNFSLHWSLIVICHPGDAANFEDEDMQKLPKVPCILHMDSIKGSHRGLKNLFQSYLWEEWKERGNQPADVSSKFLNLQFVPLELPQQENSFDCGIFLLHYMELFLEHAPVCFNPFKKQEFPNFLNKNWFPPVEASLKRAYIKDLIDQIAEDYYEKAVPASCDRDEDLCPEVLIVEERGTDAGLPQETCRSPKTEICHMNYCSSISDLENGTEPLRGIPNRECVECSKELDSCRRSLFVENCPYGQMILHDRLKNIMTPIEEVGETSEQLAKLEGSSSSGMEVNENPLFNDIFVSNSSEMTQMSDELESPSTASGELTTFIVEDSEEEDGVIDITDERSLFGLRKVKNTPRSEGNSFNCISVQEVDSRPVVELDKGLGSKRRSPVPPVRVGRRLRCSSKDLHEVFLCE